MSDEKILKHYTKVAKLVGDMFRPFVEVVVHDLRKPERSIIAIYNNNVTGREIGHGTSDLGYKRLKEEIPDEISNYMNVSPLGKKLKSSALAIRNDQNKIIGSFSMNMDITVFEEFSNALTSMISATAIPFLDDKEQFHIQHPKEEIKEIMRMVLLEKGWQNHTLSRKQKQEMVRILYQNGAFNKRGAVSIVADFLQLTRPSIYNYLKASKVDISTLAG